MTIEFRETTDLPAQSVLALYRSNHWSSAEKPEQLLRGLKNSHALVTAWDGEALVGLANSLSDGFLVVYYSHVLVHPEYRQQGVGRELMSRLMKRYEGFHQQVLIADSNAQAFFRSLGFVPAGETRSMWIFDGSEH
ncbi:MAG: GNAT family N-acetyltransferase [Planctomycetaceae bacterium]